MTIQAVKVQIIVADLLDAKFRILNAFFLV